MTAPSRFPGGMNWRSFGERWLVGSLQQRSLKHWLLSVYLITDALYYSAYIVNDYSLLSLKILKFSLSRSAKLCLIE